MVVVEKGERGDGGGGEGREGQVESVEEEGPGSLQLSGRQAGSRFGGKYSYMSGLGRQRLLLQSFVFSFVFSILLTHTHIHTHSSSQQHTRLHLYHNFKTIGLPT